MKRLPHPCPCGYLSDPVHQCTCTPLMISRYLSRISGPLLDRIDIHIEVPALKYRELADRGESDGSAAIAARVAASREVQKERFKGTRVRCKSQMTARMIKKFCELHAAGNRMLEVVTDRLGLSARSYTRIVDD
jgi:magnesium chelatase family protein